MNSQNSWVMRFFEQRTLPNESPEWIQQTFENKPILLHHYWCVCVGLINGQRRCTMVRIRAKYFKLFEGIHCVEGLANHPVWVHSLTCMRRNMLHYEDKTSFERNTFLIYNEEQKVIRLKSIRSYILLQEMDPPPGTPIFTNYQSYYTELPEKQVNTLYVSERTQRQMQNYLHTLVNAYVRELNIPYSIAKSMVMNHIAEILTS